MASHHLVMLLVVFVVAMFVEQKLQLLEKVGL